MTLSAVHGFVCQPIAEIPAVTPVRSAGLPRLRRWPVMLLAVAIEAAIAWGAWHLLHPAAVPPPPKIVMLTLRTLPVPEQPRPEPPKPVKPELRKPDIKPLPPKVALPAMPPVLVPVAAPRASAPAAITAEPPAPPPAAALVARTADAEVLNLFQAQARAAVQAALRYPGVARVRRLVGQSRIAFTYRDGHASSAHVVGSSGFDILDQAALAALQDAALPPPPPELAGHSVDMTITVLFTLQS
jgi:protein TonB